MQIKNKKVLIGIIAAVILLAAVLIVVFLTRRENAKKYYYSFVKDSNLISQTLTVVDGNGDVQEKYYVYGDGCIVSSTKADKAIVTIARFDLEKHPDLEIEFTDNLGKKYKVVYKK